MANRCKRGERGRFTKGDNRLAIKVQVRLSVAQRATYVAAGGADWLRAQLDTEAERQRHTPTAHQPFPLSPGMGGTFTTNWNHPGDKGGPSGY